MRVIGELINKDYRLTFFRHEGRISIRFERDGLTEFTLKWREGAVSDDFDKLKSSLNSEFWLFVDQAFRSMDESRKHFINHPKNDKNQLPDII